MKYDKTINWSKKNILKDCFRFLKKYFTFIILLGSERKVYGVLAGRIEMKINYHSPGLAGSVVERSVCKKISGGNPNSIPADAKKFSPTVK